MKTLFILFLLLLPTQAQDPPALEDSFREALYAEEVDGNPEAALESYRQLSEQFQKQRTLAARTLYRQAECLRKLDRTDEAITTYQALLTRYPENENLAKLAQENLTALGQEPDSSHLAQAAEGYNDPEDQKIAQLKKLLTQSPDLLNTGPLTDAAQNSQLKVATFLLDSGADVSRGNGNGSSPLQVAANAGHQAMCELLIAHGADIQLEGPEALKLALIHGHQTIIQYFLSLGLVPNSSHLAQAAEGYNDPKSLTQLLNALPESQKAAILNPNLEEPPLFAALEESPKSIHLLKLLLEHGADPNQISRDHNLSPLAFLILSKLPNQRFHKTSFTMMETLLSNGADPNLRSGEDSSSLLAQLFTLQESNSLIEVSDQAIQILLDAGADWNKAEPTLLKRALELNAQKWLDEMLQAGVLDTYPKENQQWAINTAVRTANSAALKALIERGLIPYKSATHDLIQNLFCKFSGGSRSFGLREDAQEILTCLELVLAKKPDLNYQSASFQIDNRSLNEKHTPLQFLAQYGFYYSGQEIALQVLKQLLEAGADPNFSPQILQSSRSPVTNISPFLNEPLALLLFDRDALSSPSKAEAIKTLLKAGANPEVVKHLNESDLCNRESQIPKEIAGVFPELWRNANFSPQNNPHRPNGLWISQGLTALQNDLKPTFRCLLSKESAAVPTTLKDFVHRAFQEQDRTFDLSGEQPLLIHRLDEAEPTSILFREHLASGQDVSLQWGDIIEIPARPSESKLPDDEVTTFLRTLRPIDLAITLGENQTLTNANNPTGQIFRYQPKSTRLSLERIRIASGIVPFFRSGIKVSRAHPDTGELIPANSRTFYPGDRIHYHVQQPEPGPVTQSGTSFKLCQSLDGPYWEVGQILSGGLLPWLPERGLASILQTLAQPHGLALQPIDWEKAHVLVRRLDMDTDEQINFVEFFQSPPQQWTRASLIFVLPPAEKETPFPESFKELLTKTLSTPWALKIGMEDPIEKRWAPRFLAYTRDKNKYVWQAPALNEQTTPALPLIDDLLYAQLETRENWKNWTPFPSQRLIRINLTDPEEKNGPPRKPTVRKVPRTRYVPKPKKVN